MVNKLEISKVLFPFLALFFLLFSTNSFGTSYYVSTAGSDANTGTSIGNAWATIAKVNSTVFLPGDVLYFEGGQTFNGNIYLSSSDANDPHNIFTISSYGTGKATIKAGTSYGIYAYNTQGFSVSNLILDGNSVSTNTGAGVLIFSDLTGDVKLSNISFSDVEIKNFGGEGVKIYTTKNLTGYQNVYLNNLNVHDVTKNGIIVFGYITQTLVGWQHKNVIVSNCEVYNVPGSGGAAKYEGSGIVLEGVDSGVIQNCVAHDNGQNNTLCGGPAGIWTLESNRITIQHCESYRNHSGSGCDGLGFDFDGGVSNSMMQYNYAHENDGAGYLMGQYDFARPWSNNTMRYNISENDGVTNEGGIGLFKGAGTSMNGAYIYNNTIYTSSQTGNPGVSVMYFANLSTGINNAAFYNNILFANGAIPLVNIPSGFSAFFAGNIYWTLGGSFSVNYQGSHYSTLASWRATFNELVDGVQTGFNGDPLLTSPGSGGTIGYGNSLPSLNSYKVGEVSSPAYQAALDLNALFSIKVGYVDFWGNVLPGGIFNDIGANQLSTILPTALLGFHGSCSGTEQLISWTTAEESNMKSFELMQSSNGVAFSKLAEINPKGSNSNYSFVNNGVLPGNDFYQLKMIDLDGSVTYSHVLFLQCEEVTNKIRVGPNPFRQFLNVSIEAIKQGMATMTLYDGMGKMLSQKNAQIVSGNNSFVIDGLDNLPAATYYLQIVSQDKTEHFKLIKAGR